jgi:ATP-dependent helicase/nuclease subunit B
MDAAEDPPSQHAARQFLAREGHRCPDFSACLLLVPHHHAAQDFRRALRRLLPADTHPALRPPRLLTFPEWARQASPAIQEDAPSRRLAELQDFLRRTGQLPQADLWQAAQELLALLERLDEWDTPQTQAQFADLARQRAGNAFLGLEAAIVQGVWQAFRHAPPGRARAHGQRLARLAAQAGQDLYLIPPLELSPQENACLEAWSHRQSLHVLPLSCPRQDRQDILHAAWTALEPPMAERAGALAATLPQSPLAGKVCIHPAPSLEAAARAAESCLLEWLQAGRQKIALVALDRMLARRLRALLERRQILVQDETGWAFSTSGVSHVLERWLALVTGPVLPKGLLDLLKSPYVLSSHGEARQQGAHQLAGLLRRHPAPADLAGYIALARAAGQVQAATLLGQLQTARQAFSGGRHPLAVWMAQLRTSLEALEATPALDQDPIGHQLLALLASLERDCQGLTQRFSLTDWRRWLFLHLEQETFADASVESPLRLTHLGAACQRELDGVLILGAGAAHLPGPPSASIFNDATLRQLGLPDSHNQADRVQAQLIDILGRTPRVAFIWQSEADGDPAPLSPWLRHLDAFHQSGWQTRLIQPPNAVAPVRQDTATPTAIPDWPRLDQLPRRVSVSGWQSLVACPYQFFARHGLGLNELDDFPEEMDKAEYGSLVHDILARFHTNNPVLAGKTAPHWIATLQALTEAAFAPLERRNLQALAWRLRWARHIPAYLEWAVAREAAGWRFAGAETTLEKAIPGLTEALVLHGRADRIDRRDDDMAVLDYKTQARQTLKAKLAPGGEDVQLAAYAWLADAGQVGFVSLDEDKVQLLETPPGEDQDIHAQAAAEAERLARTFQALAEGRPLPAQGAPATCAWCEMEGLCRRAHLATPVP